MVVSSKKTNKSTIVIVLLNQPYFSNNCSPSQLDALRILNSFKSQSSLLSVKTILELYIHKMLGEKINIES